MAGDCGASLKSLAGTLLAIFAAAVANADARITEIRREYASTRAQLATYIQAEFDWKGSSTDSASATATLRPPVGSQTLLASSQSAPGLPAAP